MAATVSSSLLSSGCEYPHCLYINLYNFSPQVHITYGWADLARVTFLAFAMRLK